MISLKSFTDEVGLGEVHGVPHDEGGPGPFGGQPDSAWAESPGISNFMAQSGTA